MRKIKLFLTALAVMISSVAFAQKITVTGIVTDASNGEPVIGATVHEKGTMNGVTTDLDGNYSISVPKNAILVFSSIGYQTVEILADGKAKINCELPTDAEILEDAVVVGYGSAKKVGTVIGSLTTVKTDALKNAPSSSALDALQGQVAGLAVMTTGGVAGDNNVSMTLHGTGSLGSSSQPLFVIDGIPSSSRAIMALNPHDILSISVLKDASATSIYGSRAANGVVYVTTKSGGYNSKATVTVRSQAGISTLADMTLYENMMSGPELKEFWIKAGLMTPEQIYNTYTSQGHTADTKWYNYTQQFNNPQFQNDVTVEGGGEKVAYMIGASQFHQRGTAIGNVYDRYTVRSNVQGRPKDWLKVGANLGISYDKRTNNPNWGSSSGGAAYTSGGLSYLLNPLYSAIDPKTGKEYEIEYPNGMTNHHYYMKSRMNQVDRIGLNASFFAEIEPVKNLKITSRAGVDGSIQKAHTTALPSSIMYAGNGYRSRQAAVDYSATITNTIEYSFNIGRDHHFILLAGQEGISNEYDYFSAYSEGQNDDRLLNLQNGTQPTYDVSESYTASKFLSFFGRLDYSLMDKYYFDASIRHDSSSRFGPDNRNALFWAAGGMWKIKREAFMSGLYWLNDLNLKVSYGTQGNANVGDYSHYGLVAASSDYAESSSKVVAQAAVRDLSWENQSLLTVGLNGRIADFFDFNVEFYRRNTTNMLMAVPYNYTTGFTNVYDNVGSLQNTGIDITLGFDILRGKDYFFRASANFNYNDEKVTELFQGLERWEIANTGLAYVIGEPVLYYAPIYAGVDPEDGAPMWYIPGDNIDETTMNETTKKYDEASLTQNTGLRYHTPINGGFSLSGGWRGITVQADFSYVLGKTIINNDGYFYSNPVQNLDSTQHKEVADFWTPENRDAKFPDWSKGYSMQFDTHLYENADFLRLKNFQVAYDLPRRFLGNQRVLNGVKLSFTGRNLFTVTNYSGIDPEVDSNVTYGIVGNSKQFLFGLELTF